MLRRTIGGADHIIARLDRAAVRRQTRPMIFHRIDALTAPGDPARPNDDAWAARARFAAVLDGATGLGGKLMDAPSDAAWLATRAAETLARRAEHATGHDLIRAALTEIEAEFLATRRVAPTERYELPMASLMMIEILEPYALAANWFGDCIALVMRPGEPAQTVGEALDHRGDETARAAALAASLGIHPAGALSRPEFLADRRAARNRHNTEGGAWVLAPDRACADHAMSAHIAAPAGSLILLASDGFSALVSDYARYDPTTLVEAALRGGLKPLLEELRRIEDEDPHGARFPRFKKSDDATAVLLRVE